MTPSTSGAQRPLSLDEEQLSPAFRPFDDQPLGRAREEVRHDGVHRDPPPSDRDAGLPRGHEDGREPAPARRQVELDGDGLLPDRAVRADGEDDLRVHLEVGAGRDAEPVRRPTQIAQPDAVLLRELASSGSSDTNSCSPLSTSRPLAMQLFRSSRQAGGKRPPWVATPTMATVGPYRSASSTVPTIGILS